MSTPSRRWLPTAVTATVAFAMLVHGPMHQFADYHAFADQRLWLGVPRAGDVLSNAGFGVIGTWGLARWWRDRGRSAQREPGYLLFLIALVLTAAGSGFYHLAPDDGRLVWDRLPIALGCVGLLAAFRAGTHAQSVRAVLVLAAAAVASVAWWWATNGEGHGDLRPYLLLQVLPMLLIPLWQAIHGATRGERLVFAMAIGLYLIAKIAELNDRDLFALTGWISGHTIKHLLAAAAAAAIVWCFERSRRSAGCGAELHDMS